MSILGTTEELRSVWQRRAVKALATMLEAAERRGLPTLQWTVTRATGTLLGYCADPDMEKRRAEFLTWVDFLGIEDWRAWDFEGVTHMSGNAGNAYHGGSGVAPTQVRIAASIDRPSDMQAGA